MAKIKIYGQLDCVTTQHILATADQITTTSGQTVQQVIDNLAQGGTTQGGGTGGECTCNHDYATDDDINALFI